MRFWQRIVSFLRRRKTAEETEEAKEEPKSFYMYIREFPRLLTYFRREKGVPLRELELLLMDDEEEPAWRIGELLEPLIPELNLLYMATDRPEAFEEAADQAMEEHGLLLVLLPRTALEDPPGNLTVDLRSWEKHLDIARALSI